jgi:hypothetical protein
MLSEERRLRIAAEVANFVREHMNTGRERIENGRHRM